MMYISPFSLSFCQVSVLKFVSALMLSICSATCFSESSAPTEPFIVGTPEPNSKTFRLPRKNARFSTTFRIVLDDQHSGMNELVLRFNSSARHRGGDGTVYSELKFTREDCAVSSSASLMTQDAEGIYSYYDYKSKPSALEDVRVEIEQLSHKDRIYRYRVSIGGEYTEFQFFKPLKDLEIYSAVGAIKVMDVVGGELK